MENFYVIFKAPQTRIAAIANPTGDFAGLMIVIEHNFHI